MHTVSMRYKVWGIMLPIILMLLCCLCGCEQVEDLGSLSEFSHPYAGEYVCDTLTLGGEDCLHKFEYLNLTKTSGGEFSFRYRTNGGLKGGYEGEYSVSPEGDEITFSAKYGARTASRTFPYEKGAVHVNLQFGTKLLHAEFRFP